jgi:hypothetical protein
MKRCFIIGAGASIGHTDNLFPTINTFFRKMFDDTILDLIPELRHEAFDYVDRYIENRFGYSITEDEVDIEKILTGLEIDIERYPDDPDYPMVRFELIEFIIWLLAKLQNIVNIESGQYHLLYEILQARDTIVTFNWDCLLDSILSRPVTLSDGTTRVSNEQYNNYCGQLTCAPEFSTERWSNPAPINRPKYRDIPPDSATTPRRPGNNWGYYLKMHGSIDWFYCNNPSCKTHPDIWAIDDPLSLKICGHCYEDLSRLIIPPILNKGIREHPTIRRIWSLARVELMEAEEVIIWGYSLPPTDFYSNWLLRQARTERLKKLILINPALFNNDGSEEITNRLNEPFKGIIEDEDIEKYPTIKEYYDAEKSYSSC